MFFVILLGSLIAFVAWLVGRVLDGSLGLLVTAVLPLMAFVLIVAIVIRLVRGTAAPVSDLIEGAARVEAGEGIEFDAWSAQHAGIAGELEQLHELCQPLRRSGAPAHEDPAASAAHAAAAMAGGSAVEKTCGRALFQSHSLRLCRPPTNPPRRPSG